MSQALGPSPGQDVWVSVRPRAAAGSTHACHHRSPGAAGGSRVLWLSGSAGMLQMGSPPSSCRSQPQFPVTALEPGRRAAVCASLEPAQGFWGLPCFGGASSAHETSGSPRLSTSVTALLPSRCSRRKFSPFTLAQDESIKLSFPT